MSKKQQTIWQMIDAIVWNLEIYKMRVVETVNDGIH